MSFVKYWPELVFSALCLVVLIQLFYYCFFFLRLAHYEHLQKDGEVPLSVIVCARNESGNIRSHLPEVLQQRYTSEHEYLLVDDQSTDNTAVVLAAFKQQYPRLATLELKHEAKTLPGKKFPLSKGIAAARYETLLLTDADCAPASDRWMHLMQSVYTSGIGVVLGYGAYRKKDGLLNKVIRFETFHSALQYLSYALAGLTYMGVGRNLSYRRELYFDNDGFASISQVPGGDDDLFINKVATKRNTTIMIDPAAHTLSEPKSSWKEWYTQKTRHYSTAKYYQLQHKILLGLYSATQVLTYPLFLLAFLFFDWQLATAVFASRLVLQAYVYYRTMRKLNEADLWPLFLLLEIGMCFYYALFLPSLFRRAKKTWN
ncbi:glycosyltransferase [Segetibacter sp. 3557_3]|nr:glycosyltransferase [Segetibacter sp. 3557_3]